MDELLQRALDRREALRTELAAIESFIQTYAPLKDQSATEQKTRDLFADARKSRGKRASKANEISAAMDAAEAAIIEAGRPLSRSALLQALEKAGHPVEGTDKSKVLGTNLWRSKRFYNLKGAGYWPISKPIPEQFQSHLKRQSMLFSG